MALSGKVGGVFAPSTTAGTDITAELHDGNGTTVITLGNEYIQPHSESITVDGTAQIRNKDYSINYITAEITPLRDTGFATGVDNVSVDYTHYTMEQIGGFFDWSVDESAEVLETTSFDNSGHKSYVSNLKDWTSSANRYWASTDTFDEWLGSFIVVSLYMDKDTGMNRFEGWGIINTKSTSVAVDSVVEESIDIQGSGILTYRAG